MTGDTFSLTMKVMTLLVKCTVKVYDRQTKCTLLKDMSFKKLMYVFAKQFHLLDIHKRNYKRKRLNVDNQYITWKGYM